MPHEDYYRRGRYDREYYDEPYPRSLGGRYEESYNEEYGDEPPYRDYRPGGYSDPYRRRYANRYYGDPGEYGYGRNEYDYRGREPLYGRGYERRYRGPHYRRPFRQDIEERGFIERAGDEIRSWFGDEEAERRRRWDEMHKGYAGRGPRNYRRSDERIREDLNDRLTENRYVDATDIEVNVNNGLVTLTGRVGGRDEKYHAEAIAESVTGVTDVSNQLHVGPSVPYTNEPDTTRARTART